ncbi:MAG: DUF4142 domain-containing protein [Pseudomonadota bacterium]|nr:DUF4142 domain-containing protein [Pseudomonadota bacterium]
MRNLFLTAAAAASLSACAAPGIGPGGKLPLQPPPMGVPHNAVEYMMLAASGDLLEIQTAQLLLQRGRNPQLRGYAQQMIEHHTRLSAALMAAARQGGVAPPPPRMLNRHANMLNLLAGEGPDTFELSYLRMQLVAHNEALLVHGAYAAAGENPALKAAAAAAAPVITGHLQQARVLGMPLTP